MAREEVVEVGDEDGDEDARPPQSGRGRDICKMFFDFVVNN